MLMLMLKFLYRRVGRKKKKEGRRVVGISVLARLATVKTDKIRFRAPSTVDKDSR